MKLLFLTLSLFFFSCTIPTTPNSNTSTLITKLVAYSKDSRTNLCFAIITSNNSNGNIVSITQVPCTFEVEQLIESNKPTQKEQF